APDARRVPYLGLPSNPEGARHHLAHEHTYRGLQLRPAAPVERVRREQDLVVVVKREERLEQVLLGPIALVVENPVAPVIIGQEDVVEMDRDTRSERWQDVEDEVVDVAANLDGVGRVDEQQVAVLQ